MCCKEWPNLWTFLKNWKCWQYCASYSLLAHKYFKNGILSLNIYRKPKGSRQWAQHSTIPWRRCIYLSIHHIYFLPSLREIQGTYMGFSHFILPTTPWAVKYHQKLNVTCQKLSNTNCYYRPTVKHGLLLQNIWMSNTDAPKLNWWQLWEIFAIIEANPFQLPHLFLLRTSYEEQFPDLFVTLAQWTMFS